MPVGAIPWGTHCCHFFETLDDLTRVLVPYFEAGLAAGEYCLWVTHDPLAEAAALEALRGAVPGVDEHLEAGALEIVPSVRWYMPDDRFDAQRVVDAWKAKLALALERGYAGMRVNGNEAWLTTQQWDAFADYENALHDAITGERMLVLCTYPLRRASGTDVFDVTRAHDFAVARRRGSIEVVEAVQAARARAEIVRLNAALEQRVLERTRELARTEQALGASEERLRHAHKMQAVGQLAGGIAHDFNNLLTVIRGNCDVALDELEDASHLREALDDIRHAADRAATLTHQLLAFARKQVLRPEILDLNAVVTEMDRMLCRLVGDNIQCHLRLAPDLAPVYADAGQIEQVIMNLVVNARDAMPHGGELTIATRNVPACDGGDATPAVVLTVSDTGTGMDERTRARAFEPFFTTKPKGKGTGLGLATVHGIVEQSGGAIEVDSEVGRGSTFRICFPRAALTGPATRQPQPQPRDLGATDALHGSETVLLAEDDGMVRRLLRSLLLRMGYAVIDASDGGAALSIAIRHPGPIALLVTDVLMPGMTGGELWRRVSALRPETRVLFVSAYAGDDASAMEGVAGSGAPVVPKPFEPAAFAAAVHAALDRRTVSRST